MTDPNSGQQNPGQPDETYGQQQPAAPSAPYEAPVPPAPQYGEQAPQYGEHPAQAPQPDQYGQPAAQYGQQPTDPYGQPAAPYGQQPTDAYGQPAGYGQPAAPYGQQPYGYAQPATQKTNLMAILSIIAPFVGFSLVGLVLGIIGLNQIKKTGEQGRGLALAGTIVSGVFVLLSIIAVIFWIIFVVSFAGSSSYYSDF